MKVPAPQEEKRERLLTERDEKAAGTPSTPAAKYGRKARRQSSSSTPSTPGWKANSAIKKRKDSLTSSTNSNKRKVASMSNKERLQIKSSVKDIKEFFVKMTQDRKVKDDDDRVSRGDDDRVSRGDDDEVCLSDGLSAGGKVSVSLNDVNCCDIQSNAGTVKCVGVDDLRPDEVMSRVRDQGDDDEGKSQFDGDEGRKLYSNVQSMIDEKLIRLPEYSMKTGKLTLKTTQNQTLGGGESNRHIQRTLQSKILVWERMIQREKVTDDSTETNFQPRPHGQTDNDNNNPVV